MAMFKARGPDGKTYSVEANSPEEAGDALDEMINRFDVGFNPSAPENTAAYRPEMDAAKPDMVAAADEQMYGEADRRGRIQTVTNAMTMGFGDEFLGALAGGLSYAAGKGFDYGYDKMTGAIRGDIARYADRHPIEHAALDIAGSIPTALVPGGAAVRGAGMSAKVARGAIAGAGYGATRGFGEGTGSAKNRVKEAIKGGVSGAAVGAVVPVVGNAVGKAVSRRLGRGAVPSVEQLDDAAKALYQRADNAGVAVQPRALQRLTTVLPQRMNNMGFDPVLHPNTARAMAVIEQRAAGGMQPTGGAHTVFSLGEIENMRRVIRESIKASSGPNGKADRQKAQALLDQFDTWMNGLQPRDMLSAGPVSGREAIGIVQEARGLWARKSKGDILADIVEDAQLDDNVERSIRNGFKRLAKNKSKIGAFTKPEQDAIRKVARGGDMGWITRALSTFAPSPSAAGAVRGAIGGGLGFAMSGGNPAVAAVVPAIGYGAKKLGDMAIRKAADTAGGIVRSGGSIPISPKGKVVGDYASRLIGTGGQAAAPALMDR